MIEFNSLVQKILTYLHDRTDVKYKRYHAELIKEIHPSHMSGLYLVAIHLSILTFSEPKIQVLICYIVICSVFYKLYKFHKFMSNTSKYRD